MRSNRKIAIDLLWLRPGEVGGTEFYIRNLLDGFMELEDAFCFVLLLSKDNENTFEKYFRDTRFEKIVVNIESKNIAKRIIWQNIFQNHILRKNKLKNCFVPVYCRPIFNGGINYINTIHDIQAFHYPQYHLFYEVVYSKLCWKIDSLFSKKIIAITNFVKEDLIQTYKIKFSKIEVLYNPVSVHLDEIVKLSLLKSKFDIIENGYYYTVAQMIPHKNLETLIKVMVKIKQENIDLPCKLLISGISGNDSENIINLIRDKGMQDNIILTGFVSNEERNGLYRYCKAFLFPSIFEGFGMPPVEAMILGADVITTRCASLPEVTQEKAVYVKDPYCIDDWIDKMLHYESRDAEFDRSVYERSHIAKKYLDFLVHAFS